MIRLRKYQKVPRAHETLNPALTTAMLYILALTKKVYLYRHMHGLYALHKLLSERKQEIKLMQVWYNLISIILVLLWPFQFFHNFVH